jgi:hypothetical protein
MSPLSPGSIVTIHDEVTTLHQWLIIQHQEIILAGESLSRKQLSSGFKLVINDDGLDVLRICDSEEEWFAICRFLQWPPFDHRTFCDQLFEQWERKQ